MTRPSTPERIYAAGREATKQRLIGDGELRDRAEALLASWEASGEAKAAPDDGRRWEAAWRWMDERRAKSRGREI